MNLEENWVDSEGNPDGAISSGIGYTISWQRGSLAHGRTGAFLIEVLTSCLKQLERYQDGKFACNENALAEFHIQQALILLNQRLDRRKQEGILGTHITDKTDE
jgi:hypothetical protein